MLFDWWWADPFAALVIAAMAVKEGIDAWRGRGCCTPAGVVGGGSVGEDTCGHATDCDRFP